MIWGCMSYKGVGKLVVIKKTINSIYYRRILSKNLIISANEMEILNDFIFHHDNDPKHKV